MAEISNADSKNLINKSKPLSVVFRTVANSFLLSQELQSEPKRRKQRLCAAENLQLFLMIAPTDKAPINGLLVQEEAFGPSAKALYFSKPFDTLLWLTLRLQAPG